MSLRGDIRRAVVINRLQAPTLLSLRDSRPAKTKALELPPLRQLNKQECPSWTYLELGDGPQNAPLLGTIVFIFRRKISLLKLFVTLKPGYFLLICLSSFHSYRWFWLFVKVTCGYTYTGWVVIKELYCCIDISSLYLSWLQNLT